MTDERTLVSEERERDAVLISAKGSPEIVAAYNRALALLDTARAERERLAGVISLLSAEADFLLKAVRAGDPKSQLVLRCEDMIRHAAAEVADDAECVVCGVCRVLASPRVQALGVAHERRGL